MSWKCVGFFYVDYVNIFYYKICYIVSLRKFNCVKNRVFCLWYKIL